MILDGDAQWFQIESTLLSVIVISNGDPPCASWRGDASSGLVAGAGRGRRGGGLAGLLAHGAGPGGGVAPRKCGYHEHYHYTLDQPHSSAGTDTLALRPPLSLLLRPPPTTVVPYSRLTGVPFKGTLRPLIALTYPPRLEHACRQGSTS